MTTNPLKTLTAADALEFKNIQDAQISPDGTVVAFEVADRYKVDTKTPKGAIWIVNTSGGEARPFTAGPRRDRHPRWSPDSQWLAFLSDRNKDGQPQIFLLPRHGGEAMALSSVTGHIEELRWSADGCQIFFLMIDPQTEQEKLREESKDDVIEFEEHPKYARIYALDVAGKVVRPLTGEKVQAWEFDVAAGSARTALVAADNPFEWSWYQSRISVVTGPQTSGQDASSVQHRSAEGASPSATENILHQSKRQLARPVFSPDGQWIAFLTSTWSDRGVTSGDLYIVASASGQDASSVQRRSAEGGSSSASGQDASSVQRRSAEGEEPSASGEARNLTPDYGGRVSWMEWSADSRSLIFLALENIESTFGEIDIASGKMKHLWSGPVALSSPGQQTFSMSRDGGRLALVRESATEPRAVWVGRRSGDALDWTRLTDLHPQTAEYQQLSMESIQWKGADGRPMQGFLLKPHDYDPSKRYPMVTAVHGGPTSAYTWSYPVTFRVGWIGLLAAQGLVVFMPNPRGSVGWGLRFAESNLGDMGGKDFLDLMAGIDYLVAAGIADEKRLGIAGWSYGGYMTMWGVSQTDRFKAAMAGAGIANWTSFHGLTKYPTFDALFYGADPYDIDKEAAYELFSPLTYIKRIKTPTLVIHGEKDPDVPAAQAYEFHRALKDHGVETQLAIYPRELHGFNEKSHILDMWERVAKWFVARL
jgi:dipeptidyl aminopeptidase/acylaminoacyl peptidase